MKQDASFFDDKDPQLLYIAKKLRDALKLESILAEFGIDFGVEADKYRGGIVFPSERVGAFFYVLPETLDSARDVLQRNGWKPAESA